MTMKGASRDRVGRREEALEQRREWNYWTEEGTGKSPDVLRGWRRLPGVL